MISGGMPVPRSPKMGMCADQKAEIVTSDLKLNGGHSFPGKSRRHMVLRVGLDPAAIRLIPQRNRHIEWTSAGKRSWIRKHKLDRRSQRPFKRFVSNKFAKWLKSIKNKETQQRQQQTTTNALNNNNKNI